MYVFLYCISAAFLLAWIAGILRVRNQGNSWLDSIAGGIAEALQLCLQATRMLEKVLIYTVLWVGLILMCIVGILYVIQRV